MRSRPPSVTVLPDGTETDLERGTTTVYTMAKKAE
jgi:hypothetical protein